jgi:hypothetical protein
MVEKRTSFRMMEQFFLNLKCPGGYFAVEENS